MSGGNKWKAFAFKNNVFSSRIFNILLDVKKLCMFDKWKDSTLIVARVSASFSVRRVQTINSENGHKIIITIHFGDSLYFYWCQYDH